MGHHLVAHNNPQDTQEGLPQIPNKGLKGLDQGKQKTDMPSVCQVKEFMGSFAGPADNNKKFLPFIST